MKNIVFALVKLTLNFGSPATALILRSSVGHSPNTKNLFLRLSASDDELLSTSKMVIFQKKKSLSKLHQLAPSNAIL